MLFRITDDAAERLFSSPQEAYARLAFARLLSNYADGHHVVLLSPRYCRLIEGDTSFSVEDRAAAKNVRNRYADFGAMADILVKHATVVADGSEPIKSLSGWTVPLRWIAQNPLNMAYVLGEDLYDADILIEAAADHLRNKKLLSFSVRAIPLQGGGGNTHRVLFSTSVERQSICVCVADSDMKCPVSALGPTAERCLAVAGTGMFEVTLTSGRSIENSLPWRLIDTVENARNPPASHQLRALENAHTGSSKFLNMKRGMCGFEIGSLEEPTKKFWSNAGAAILGKKACCPGQCSKDSQPKCMYRIHDGFGNGLLGNVRRWFENAVRTLPANQYLPSPNEEDWGRLGGLVAAYAVGLKARRI